VNGTIFRTFGELAIGSTNMAVPKGAQQDEMTHCEMTLLVVSRRQDWLAL
jgi:hypothetical protein